MSSQGNQVSELCPNPQTVTDITRRKQVREQWNVVGRAQNDPVSMPGGFRRMLSCCNSMIVDDRNRGAVNKIPFPGEERVDGGAIEASKCLGPPCPRL